MNKLQLVKVTLLIVILAEEIKKVTKKNRIASQTIKVEVDSERVKKLLDETLSNISK